MKKNYHISELKSKKFKILEADSGRFYILNATDLLYLISRTINWEKDQMSVWTDDIAMASSEDSSEKSVTRLVQLSIYEFTSGKLEWHACEKSSPKPEIDNTYARFRALEI